MVDYSKWDHIEVSAFPIRPHALLRLPFSFVVLLTCDKIFIKLSLQSIFTLATCTSLVMLYDCQCRFLPFRFSGI